MGGVEQIDLFILQLNLPVKIRIESYFYFVFL